MIDNAEEHEQELSQNDSESSERCSKRAKAKSHQVAETGMARNQSRLNKYPSLELGAFTKQIPPAAFPVPPKGQRESRQGDVQPPRDSRLSWGQIVKTSPPFRNPSERGVGKCISLGDMLSGEDAM